MANSMFSRRHYEAVAGVLRAVLCEDKAKAEIIDAFCELFEADNERFNRAKFEEACER